MKNIFLFILGFCSFFGTGYTDITWSAPTAISTALTDASTAQIAIDSSGNITAIWLEGGLVRSSVMPSGGSWSSPVTVSNPAQTSTNPALKLDGSGNAMAMWIGNTQVQSAILAPGGSWISAGSPVSSTGATSLSFDINSSGNTVAVWVRSTFVESAVLLTGGSWSLVTILSAANSTNPHVVLNNAGTAMAAWHTGTTTDTINTNTLASIANPPIWGTTKSVFPAAATFRHNYPKVALDSTGNASIAWFRYNLTGTSAYSNVTLISSALPTTATTWGIGTILTSGGIRNPGDLTIKLRYDTNNNLIAVWTNSYDGESFALESSRMLFGGSWQLLTTVLAPTIYSFGMDLSIASSNSNALLTNMTWDGTSAVNIQSQEVDTANPLGTRWTDTNVFSTGNDNAYPKCAIALNGSNFNAAAVWTDFNGTNTIINAATGSGPVVIPPTSVSASQSTTNFGVYTDYSNTVTWSASSDPNLIQYNIYRNGIFFTATDTSTLTVTDHNQVQGGTVVYGVAAFTSNFTQSQLATFTLFP